MKASKKLVELMKQSQAKDTKPFDTQGEVVRVEGDIAWVHFAGGVDETPVRMTVNAEVGDNVQVRVSGGDAFLVGNGTAPPTDDKKANQAIASIKPVADAAEESRNLLGEMKTAAEEAGTTLTQIYQDAVDAKEASEEAQESAAQAAISASNASASASSAAADASSAATSANAAGESASQAQAASEAAQLAALSSITTDTLHYLATSQASGVTTQTAGWTTTVQTMTSTDKYLWTYHTYTAANGSTVDSTPVITGTYGQDGTSVTILGSYNTLAELQAAHPTGSRGDSYMVAGDLYVWNGTAWENVGQIQGPQGPQGATGDDGVSVTAVQPQYYLSTSSSSATGGSWSNSLSYVTGKYIWTRDMVTYSDGTSAPSTEIYNSALTDACKDAAEALGLIEEHQEWFWHDALGAHVLGEASGFRNDLAGNGMAIVDTSDNDAEVAHFGADGAQIGKDGNKRIAITSDSFIMQNEDESASFYIKQGASSQTQEVLRRFVLTEASGDSPSISTVVYLRGIIPNNRILWGAGAGVNPIRVVNLIPSEDLKTSSMNGVTIEYRMLTPSAIEITLTNSNEATAFVRIGYTEEYYETEVMINGAVLGKKYEDLVVLDAGTGISAKAFVVTYGRIAMLTLQVYNNNSIAPLGFIYTGTLYNYLPEENINLIGHYWGRPVVGEISSGGGIRVFNGSSSNINSSSGDVVTLTATYIFK